jgi:hypothetical protein
MRPPPTLSCLPAYHAWQMAIKAKQIFFSILCYFVHAFIYLSIYLVLKLPALNYLFEQWANKNYFHTQKSKKFWFFSSSLKYVFYICLWADFVTCQSHTQKVQVSESLFYNFNVCRERVKTFPLKSIRIFRNDK